MFGHLSNAGRKKLGLGAEWQAFAFRAIGKDSLLTFGKPEVITRGRRKGNKRWPPPHHEVMVSLDEEQQERRTYEAVTGHCAKCFGKGEELASVGQDGTKFRQCSECRGTGRAKGGKP